MDWTWVMVALVVAWVAYRLGKQSSNKDDLDDIPEDELGTLAVIAAAVDSGEMSQEAGDREVIAWSKFHPNIVSHWRRLGADGQVRLAADMKRLRANPEWQKREQQMADQLGQASEEWAKQRAAEMIEEMKSAASDRRGDRES